MAAQSATASAEHLNVGMPVSTPKVSERQAASSGQAQRDIQAALAAWAVSSAADPVESTLPLHTGDKVPTKTLKDLHSGFHRGVLYLLQKNKFKKYMFVLQKPYLYYFTSSTLKGQKMAGGFDLRMYAKQITASSQRRHSLRLTDIRQTFQVVFAATSEAECTSWLEMLAFTFDELENELTGAGTTTTGLSISKPMFVKSSKETKPDEKEAQEQHLASVRRRTGSFSSIVRSNDRRLQGAPLITPADLSSLHGDESAEKLSTTVANALELPSYSLSALGSLLSTRFSERDYYTGFSQLLVAIESQRLDAAALSYQKMQLYREESMQDKPLPPHPYSLANSAYQHALQYRRSTTLHFGGTAQNKARTFDLVLDYLLSMPHGRRSVASGSAQDVIQQGEVLLGAFTRRTTPNHPDARCDLHSVTVAFGPSGEPAGGRINSRLFNYELCFRTPVPGYQNFHIFYSLLGDRSTTKHYGLNAVPSNYPNLRTTNTVAQLPRYALASVKVALAELGLDPQQITELFDIIAAILHLMCVRSDHLQSGSTLSRGRGSRIFRPGSEEALALRQLQLSAFTSKPLPPIPATPSSSGLLSASTSAAGTSASSSHATLKPQPSSSVTANPLIAAATLLGIKSGALRRMLLERGVSDFATQVQALTGSLYRRVVAWLVDLINSKIVPPAQCNRVQLVDWMTFSSSSGQSFVGHDCHTLFRHAAQEIATDIFLKRSLVDEIALFRSQRVLFPPVNVSLNSAVLLALLPSYSGKHSLLSQFEELASRSQESSLPNPTRLVRQLAGTVPMLQPAGAAGSFKLQHSNKVEYVYDLGAQVRSISLSKIEPMSIFLTEEECTKTTVRHIAQLDVSPPLTTWLQDLEALEKPAKANYFLLFFHKPSTLDPGTLADQLDRFQLPLYLNFRANIYDLRLSFQEFVSRYQLLWREPGSPLTCDDITEASVRFLRSLEPNFRGGQKRLDGPAQRLLPLPRVLDNLRSTLLNDLTDAALTIDAAGMDGANVGDVLRYLLATLPASSQSRPLIPFESAEPAVKYEYDPSHVWQDGDSMLFLNIPLVEHLEAKRLEKMNAAASRIQLAWKRWIDRCMVLDLLRAIRSLHKFVLGWVHRRRYLKLRQTTIQLQARRRMVVLRREFLAVRNSSDYVERRKTTLSAAFRASKLAVAALKRSESRGDINSVDDTLEKKLARNDEFVEKFRRYLVVENSEQLLEFFSANEALIRIREPAAVFARVREIYIDFIADESILGITAEERQAFASQIYCLTDPPLHMYCALASRVLAELDGLNTRFLESVASVKTSKPPVPLKRGMTRSNMAVLQQADVIDMAQLTKEQVDINFLSQEESDRLRAMDDLLDKQQRLNLETLFSNNDEGVSPSTSGASLSSSSSSAATSSSTSSDSVSLAASSSSAAATPTRMNRRRAMETEKQEETTLATFDLGIVLASLQPDETFDSYVRANCQRHFITDLGLRRPISWSELAHPQTTPLADSLHPFGNRKKKAARDFEERALVSASSGATANPFAAMDELDELYMQMSKEGFDVDKVSSKEIDSAWKALEEEMDTRAAKLRQQRNAPRNLKEEQAEKKTRVALFMFNSILYLQTNSNEKEPLPIKSISFFQRHMTDEAELCDEIYCQLIKQTRESRDGSESRTFVLRGWQILSILCGLIPPSPKFIKYLVWHLEHYRASASPLDELVGPQAQKLREIRRQWAQFGYTRLSRLMANGPRTFPPGPTEYASLLRCQPFFLLRVQTADGHTKAVPIDSSTTMNEIHSSLVEKLHLRNVPGWAVFEVVNELERPINKTEKIGDELSKLEQLHGTWDQSKLVDEHGDDAGLRFIFKRQLHLEPRYLSKDPVENSLLFAQFAHEYVRGLIPLKTTDALKLAAIKLQYDAGDYNPERIQEMMAEARAEVTKTLSEAGIYSEEMVEQPAIINVSAYLPSSLLVNSERLDIEWQEDIFRLYETLKGITKDQAKGLFLKTVSETPLFGTKTFAVSHKSTWDMPSALLLGISIEGITFIDSATFEVYLQYPLAAVHRITATRTHVEVVLDNLQTLQELMAKNGFVVAGPNGQCLNQDTIVLLTRESSPIRYLASRYLEWLEKESRAGMVTSRFDSANPKYLTISARELLIVHEREKEWCLCESLTKRGVHGLVRTELIKFLAEVPDNFFDASAGSRRTITTAQRPKFVMPDTSDAQTAAAVVFDVSTRFTTQKLPTVESSKFTMVSFATRKFRTATAAKTLGLTGKQTMKTLNLESRLTFSSNTIRESLLNFTSDAYINDSAHTFEEIMAFMGDTRKRRGQTELSILQNIIQTVIKSRALRDEILCQCIKQTTDNPNPASAERGWLLLCFCVSIFLPSKDFGRYLIAYLQEHTELEGPMAKIGNLAKEAMIRLGRTLQKGARKCPPSAWEYETVSKGAPLLARVELLDRSIKTVIIDQACTVGEILQDVFAKIDLPEDMHKSLDLFMECKEIDYFRRLTVDDNYCDVMYLASTNPKCTPTTTWKFVLRHSTLFTWGGALDPKALTNQMSLHLLFYQAVTDIHEGYRLLTNEEVVAYAGLHLQAVLGPISPSITSSGDLPNWRNYVPARFGTSNSVDWNSALIAAWQSHGQMSQKEARELYILRAQESPFFGALYWKIRRDTKPYDAVVGLSCRCLFVVNPETYAPLSRGVWGYLNILTWRFNPVCLTLEVGNPNDPTDKRPIVFHTDQGEAIVQLLDRYFDRIMNFCRSNTGVNLQIETGGAMLKSQVSPSSGPPGLDKRRPVRPQSDLSASAPSSSSAITAESLQPITPSRKPNAFGAPLRKKH